MADDPRLGCARESFPRPDDEMAAENAQSVEVTADRDDECVAGVMSAKRMCVTRIGGDLMALKMATAACQRRYLSRSGADPGVGRGECGTRLAGHSTTPGKEPDVGCINAAENPDLMPASPRSSSQRPRGTSGGRRGERGLAGEAPRGAFPPRSVIRG